VSAGAAVRSRPSLPPVDRVSVTTVVDNSVDILRPDEKVARRWSVPRARKIADLRAEHGLAHHVEVARGRDTARIAFDFGLTAESMTHNFRELGLDAGAIDALALSHGHADHFGGLLGFLSAYRRRMRPTLPFYGHPNHYVGRFMERDGDRIPLGRLDRAAVARWDVEVVDVPDPVVLAEGVLLSGEMHATEPYEVIPPSMRMEVDGALAQDTFIGEQTLIAHVRDRGLVVVTSCSHRGIVGICRNATEVTGVTKIHGVIGGFHLSGLDAERIDRVVEALRGFEVDYLVPQHCTGAEALVRLAQRMGPELVVSSTGSTFTFGG
jgi:7,8-dihydropterin-6-yl-methyl-4-(beta-D-ribofuranosyl)aminobenzene 5'-phosphate synthase